MWRQARPYWGYIALTLMSALLYVPLALLLPLPLKIAVDSALGSHPLPGFLRFFAAGQTSHGAALLFAVGLLVGTTLLIYLQAMLVWVVATYTGEKLLLEFRSLLFHHVQRLSLAYHDQRGASESTYRIQYDAPAMEYIFGSGIIPLLSAALTVVGMLYVTATVDKELALIALLVCPALYVLTYRFGRKTRSDWEELKKIDSAAMSVVQEALSALRVVKAFGREEREHERFLREAARRMKRQMKLSTAQGAFELGVGMILAIGTAAVLYIGIQHVRSGQMTLGGLLLVMGYLAQLYQPLRTLSAKIAEVQSHLVSAGRAFALLDEVPDVSENPSGVRLRRAAGQIRLAHVSFGYEKERRVLEDVSLEIPSGARIGIIGATGAGKSTLANLLLRFYDPTEGSIELDGRDLREYKLADLRNQFALVLQDSVLFSTTVAENIAYAQPEVRQAEIVAAAKAAGAHDFIARLPEGYATQVGERGMFLSGGERQRISLARAFLKDAPILVLDEPTSSLDVRTEAAVLEAIGRLMRGRTTILITHRLNALGGCESVLTVRDRRIAPAEAPAPSAIGLETAV
jgi:ATP-binding cassette subfamily B protein